MEGPLWELLIPFWSVNKHSRHRQFLFLIVRFLSFGSFGHAVSEESFRNRPIRNKNRLWWPCLLMDRDKITKLYREPSIDASYQVLVHLAKRFEASMEGPLWELLILFWSVNKHSRHRQFLFLIGRFLKQLFRSPFILLWGNLNTEPSIGASHQMSAHFGKAVSEKKIFRNRIQPYL
jgi:hypothetical protein